MPGVTAIAPPVAVIGASGFVGRNLVTHLRNKGHRTLAVTRLGGPDALALDLARPEAGLAEKLAREGCVHAVICAAIPWLDACERDPEGTRLVNVTGTLALGKALQAHDIKPVFLSSDAVFSGNDPQPYTETDPPSPINEYGRQKVEVEAGLRDGGKHLIVRLTKLYGLVPHDGTLLDAMAAALMRGETVRAAFDQFFNPTVVDDAVRAIAWAVHGNMQGTMHLCCPVTVNRHQLALELAKALGAPGKVERISLDDLDTAARLPKNLSMRPHPAFSTQAFTAPQQGLERVAATHAGTTD